jgi:uncharacterized protein YegP (UPF0339 family)
LIPIAGTANTSHASVGHVNACVTNNANWKERSVIKVFKGDDGQWYWHVKAKNGKIVAQSEGYKTKHGALNGAKALVKSVRRIPKERDW